MRSCTQVPNGSTVFLRAGMDVPLGNGLITDTSRIDETRPTIDLLRSKGCKIVVAIKVGRPKGVDLSLSTKPIANYLAKSYPCKYVNAISGSQVTAEIKLLNPGELLVTENLFFDGREVMNDATLAQELIKDCDCIVQEAYSSGHRAQASIVGVNDYKPAYAGLLLEKEIAMVGKLLHAEHPYMAIIGGAKADKLSTIQGLLPKVDTILIGGALANTFLKALGYMVGESKYDESGLALAAELYKSGKIIIPVDAVVADTFAEDSPSRILPIGVVTRGMILDIGPETQHRYVQVLSRARTIVWAGPIGVFEWSAFSEGTRNIAAAVALSGAYTLAAGGDSGAALVALGYKDNISHVSTGGGVTLEVLEGKTLPVVTSLLANEIKFPSTGNN